MLDTIFGFLSGRSRSRSNKEEAQIVVTITDTQKFPIGPVQAVDAKGNPTALGGPVTFTSSDTTKLAVTPDPVDPTSATVLAVGALGAAQIVVSDTVATGIVDVTVVGGAEASINVPVGAPVQQ